MNSPDPFEGLARHYDQIMGHVNYDRWFMNTLALAGLAPTGAPHLDAACGTGTLGRQLRACGWRSFGADLSLAMIRAGQKKGPFPAVAADLRALPFSGVGMATCLFDSLNFLLDAGRLEQAIRSLHACLAPGGVLYCDAVTERMVLDHFAGQEWLEEDGGMTTRWASSYDRRTGIAETEIRVNRAGPHVIRERIYDTAALTEMMTRAGFRLLGVVDAETWRSPRRKTLRVDFVAVKGDDRPLRKPFRKIAADIVRRLRG